MHYQFIMQSLCIFSFFWWKLAGIGEYGRALSWKGNAGSQVRKTQQLSAPLWTNEWDSKGKPLSLSSRVFMTPEHTMTNHKMHLGWSFLCFFFSPRNKNSRFCCNCFLCSLCSPKNTAISITKCILKHGCGFLKLLNWNLWKNIGTAKRVVEI